MARAGHRIGVALLAAAALATCGGPAPSTRPSAPAAPPVADGCVDLGEEVWGLSWSPGGAYLAVATYAGEGDAHAWVMAPDGRLTAETVAVTHLVMQSLVVSPDGWRTWLVAKDPASPRHTLVEDRLLGRRETPLSGPISSIGWTARGYAMVEKRQAGDAVLLLNPDRLPNSRSCTPEMAASTGCGSPRTRMCWS